MAIPGTLTATAAVSVFMPPIYPRPTQLAYMHSHSYIQTYIYTRACRHISITLRLYKYIYMYTHTRIYIYIYINEREREIHIYIYIFYIYTYTQVYTYIYIHMTSPCIAPGRHPTPAPEAVCRTSDFCCWCCIHKGRFARNLGPGEVVTDLQAILHCIFRYIMLCRRMSLHDL